MTFRKYTTQKTKRSRGRRPYTSKQSVEYLETLVELLLDTIVMNRSYSTLRTLDSLEVLGEVRDMDTLAEQSPEHF